MFKASAGASWRASKSSRFGFLGRDGVDDQAEQHGAEPGERRSAGLLVREEEPNNPEIDREEDERGPGYPQQRQGRGKFGRRMRKTKMPTTQSDALTVRLNWM